MGSYRVLPGLARELPALIVAPGQCVRPRMRRTVPPTRLVIFHRLVVDFSSVWAIPRGRYPGRVAALDRSFPFRGEAAKVRNRRITIIRRDRPWGLKNASQPSFVALYAAPYFGDGIRTPSRPALSTLLRPCAPTPSPTHPPT